MDAGKAQIYLAAALAFPSALGLLSSVIGGSPPEKEDKIHPEGKVDREERKQQHGNFTKCPYSTKNWEDAVLAKRDHMDPEEGEPDYVWHQDKKPGFKGTDKQWEAERTRSWAAGSLEKIVEDLVKTWEAEVTHKRDCSQWKSIDPKTYKVSANGGKWIGLENFTDDKIGKYGNNYQTLMMSDDERLKKLEKDYGRDFYDYTKYDWDSSMQKFRDVFKNGFPWELTKLYTGPPTVKFDWRHWAIVNGTYKDESGKEHPPTGRVIEMLGFCEVEVDENLKIQSINVSYKPEHFFMELEQCPISYGCPYDDGK